MPALLLILVSFLSLLPGPGSAQQGKTERKILFVGNSLTYYNHLPGLLREIAVQDGVQLTYSHFLLPDYSLEDHWKDKKVQQEIASGNYDVVLVQQGPSALPESQKLLVRFTRAFSELTKRHHATLALFMVWPSKARYADFDKVITSYSKAASQTNSLLCPAGIAWQRAWRMDSSLALYGPDEFHPSLAGSVLSALAIYGSLWKKSNFDFIKEDAMSWQDQVDTPTFQTLKKAAIEAIRETNTPE